MKIIIAGGDGFCGWPTALYLSRAGHEITIVDNLSRRNWDEELCSNSLTPIISLEQRVSRWHELTGYSIQIRIGDLTEYNFLRDLFIELQPEAFVHFAEQRSAPYSMMDREHA